MTTKLVLFLCVALLVVGVINAAPDKSNCGRHGDPCVSDGQCCGTIKCHRYANRCQVQITAEELMKQREKILGRRGKDY
ncbi:omega-conotoxin-like protein 1 isoform X2 [Cephus cinctus]|uniref:Omega-conotoxin-like protein 1 isoform X2 n=1 Tax=Cephus cinctus TaxID=211228 RepID=A0AAJ7FCN7_CEPCN|nr:omega-conotoxin-like protein 1 isoform X2 [Cephus cinctus]